MDDMTMQDDSNLSPQEQQIADMAQRLLDKGTPVDEVRALVKRQMASISGRLARKNQRLNQNERDRAEAASADASGGFGSRFGGELAAGLSTLPGGEAFVTGLHALASGHLPFGQGYANAYQDVQRAMNEQGAGRMGVDVATGRKLAQAAGIGAQVAYLNPTVLGEIPMVGGRAAQALTAAAQSRKAGAAVGGTLSAASRALEANPSETLSQRLKGTLEAGAAGAGMGYAMPWLMGPSRLATAGRTAAGAGLGAYAGSEMAPQGNEIAGAVAGGLAGGTAAYNPAIVADAARKIASKIPSVAELTTQFPRLASVQQRLGAFAPQTGTTLQTIQDVANAAGQRGAALRELEGRQAMRVGGSILGESEAGAGAIVGKRAEQQARSTHNYGQALDVEAPAALQRYAEHRGAIEDANTERMLAYMSQETPQSTMGAPVTPAPNAPLRDIMDAWKQRVADAQNAKIRQTDIPAKIPTATGVAEYNKWRTAMQGGAEAAYAPGELGRVAGTGEPTYTGAGMPPALEPPDALALTKRVTPHAWQMPETLPARGETVAQQAAREALEQRSIMSTMPYEPMTRKELPALTPVPGKTFPGVDKMMQHPIVAEVASELRALPQWKYASADDPRFLDAIYQGLSDQSVRLQQGIGRTSGLTANNMPRQTLAAVKDAQNTIMDVFREMMPSYDVARVEHAKAASWMDAYRKGYTMMGSGEETGRDIGRKGATAMQSQAQKLAERYGADANELISAMRRGAVDRINDIQSSVPLTQGRAGVLARRPFTSAEADMPRLEFALGEQAGPYSQLLAQQAADVASGERNAKLYLPTNIGRMISGAVNDAAFVPALQTNVGANYIHALRQNPAAFQDVLASYRRGAQTTKTAQQVLAGLLGKSLTDFTIPF